MTDISHKTWKYLHGPDDVVHLSFATGGVPRSFSLVQYAATEQAEIDFTRNGVAVIDNDNLSVVLDEHLKGREIDQLRFMSSARRMDWTSFAAFCTEHPRYRGRAGDMYLPRPDPGILVNQIQRGVMHAPADESDLRSPSLVAAHADAACPYSFPAATRSGMIAEILSHSCLQDDRGSWRIAWDSHLDGIMRDATRAGPATEQEEAWIAYCRSNPELLHQVAGEILEPYFTGRIATWPKTDAGRYAFLAAGAENSSALCLAGIDGADLGFRNRGDLGAFLDDLEDGAVRDIWKLLRVVDHDLSEPVVRTAFDHGLARARKAFDADRDCAIEPAAGPA